MLKDAILSDDRRYRYVLSRTWDETKEASLALPVKFKQKHNGPFASRLLGYSKSAGVYVN